MGTPSMWCCTQIRGVSTYLIIIFGIFSFICIGLAIHQVQVEEEGGKKKYKFAGAKSIEDLMDANLKEANKALLIAECELKKWNLEQNEDPSNLQAQNNELEKE